MVYNRRTPKSPTPNSNSEKSLLNETVKETTSKYGKQVNVVLLPKSIHRYYFIIIAQSDVLCLIMHNLQALFEQCKSIGEQLVLEKVEEHGMKGDWMLTLKIHARNFGKATK